MKKIDLHIHTVPTFSDSGFVYSLETFKKYVTEARLDAVAVTNHDMFDGAQFRLIQKGLGITVFPGIEINVEKGHVLLIGEAVDIDDFQAKANLVTTKIRKAGDFISVEELKSIYGDLSKYLVIPHYEKNPALGPDTVDKLKPYISAGEVDSAKKFVRTWKDDGKLTPVLFSDARMKVDFPKCPTRQTFIDCGSVSLSAVKECLRDRTKVTLSEKDGNRLVQILDNGQMISTGLNVLIGARSTGKTHTLNEISIAMGNGVKYIKQFDLVQQNEGTEFKNAVERRRSVVIDQYLAGLKRVVDTVMNVNLVSNDLEVERYVETLVKSAVHADRQDAYSKAALFNEVEYPVGNTTTLHSLIQSVQQVIENVEFRPIIEKHVNLDGLKALACELIELLWSRALEIQKKALVNELVREIKGGLKVLTAAVQIEDVDLYKVAMDKKRVARFVSFPVK